MGVLCVACEAVSDVPVALPPPVSSAQLAPHLTGIALAHLDPSGEISVTEFRTRPLDAVTEERARALAIAFVAEAAHRFPRTLERQAGRQIAFEALELREGVIYAETPYHPAPPTAPVPARAAVGPSYIFTFADEQGPAVAASVSVHTQEYQIESGRVIPPRVAGYQFELQGISATHGTPISPEEAVLKAAALTQAKVTTPPAFIWYGVGFSRFVGVWRVTLDRTVSLDTPGAGVVETDEVYVRKNGEISVPVPRGTAARSVPRAGSVTRAGFDLTLMPRDDFGKELLHATALMARRPQ